MMMHDLEANMYRRKIEKARTAGAKDKKPRKRGSGLSFQDTYYKHFHQVEKEGVTGLARISRIAEERAVVEFQNKGRHSKEFEKARTPGAKDKQPRKRFHKRTQEEARKELGGEPQLISRHGGPIWRNTATGREVPALQKSRTAGAKDIKPRRRRGAIHNVLTAKGYEKGSISHPKTDFYHKLDTGDLVLVSKKDGRWSHYTNEKGFTKQGSSHEDLNEHLK